VKLVELTVPLVTKLSDVLPAKIILLYQIKYVSPLFVLIHKVTVLPAKPIDKIVKYVKMLFI